jgi:Lysylphosphatidylglycerol synthase TM region
VRRALVAATSVVGVAAFAYTVCAVGAREIHDVFLKIGWGFGAILLLSGAREASRALAWSYTLDRSVALPFRNALAARLVGEALNTLLPMGFVVGEPAKAAHVAGRLPFATAFAALAIEFGFYIASLLLLFVVAAFFLLPSSIVFASAVLVLVVFGMFEKTRSLFRTLLGLASADRHRAGAIGALEVAYHVLGIGEAYITLGLINPHPPSWKAAIALESVNRAVTMLFKMLPMRVGVDEAAAAMVANRLAIGTASGVMLALVRKIRLLFWSAVGLVLMLMRVRKQIARRHAATDLQIAKPVAATLQ